jgi:hypothetical protein
MFMTSRQVADAFWSAEQRRCGGWRADMETEERSGWAVAGGSVDVNFAEVGECERTGMLAASGLTAGPATGGVAHG